MPIEPGPLLVWSLALQGMKTGQKGVFEIIVLRHAQAPSTYYGMATGRIGQLEQLFSSGLRRVECYISVHPRNSVSCAGGPMPWQEACWWQLILLRSDGFGSDGAGLFQTCCFQGCFSPIGNPTTNLYVRRRARTFPDTPTDSQTKRGVEHKGLGFTGLLFRL